MRKLDRLSAPLVAKTTKVGLHADGGGLYLQVTGSGGRSWLYRYTLRGTARAMGLGPAPTVTLAKARLKAAECRRMLVEGVDPLEARKAADAAKRLAEARTLTFDQCAAAYIEAHRAAWKNAKHLTQWRNTLDTYAKPVIGSLAVQDVDLTLVSKVLEPIWTTKTETASRLRGRIETVLAWATVRGYRVGENPARWKGHLDALLPAPSRVQTTGHHAALPYSEMGGFMEALRGQKGSGARALEFAILTAARTGETLGARWSEIDLNAAVWTVPAARMKGGVEHRVPLSAPVLAVLAPLHRDREGDFVFPGGRAGRPLSNTGLLAVLVSMKRSDLTVHGFRSSFRDWTSELTSYSRDVAEMALAHAVGDKVEAAYRRGDLFEKRARLMAEWGQYCGRAAGGGAEVVPLRSGRNK